MDTDDLTPMAYDVIVRASDILDILKTDIADRSSKHDNEDSFLKGTVSFIKAIRKEPEEYLDYWGHTDDIEQEYFEKKLSELEKYVFEVIDTPLKDRGTPPFE